MPEYLSPGVFVEEVDAGPKPIEGVSTSTTGTVGVTERGPSGGTAPGDTTNRAKPVLVTSFAEFTRIFGGFLPEPDPHIVNRWALDAAEGGRWWLFPLSVKGFFDNGGQRLYVRRVFAQDRPGIQGATRAETLLGRGIIAEVSHDAAATERVVHLQHLFGIQNNTQVTIVAGGRAIAPAQPFLVASYDASANTITLNNPVGQELKSGRDFVFVTRAAPAAGPPDTRTLRFHAKSVGAWGGNIQGDHPLDGIRMKVRPMAGATLRILPDPAGGNASRAALTADAAANAAGLPVNAADLPLFADGDHVSIRGREFAVAGAPSLNDVAIVAVPNGAAEAGNTVTITTGAAHGFQNGDTVTVAGVAVGGYNGTWVVSNVTNTTFDYTNPVAGLAASGGGHASHPTINIRPVRGSAGYAEIETAANNGAVRNNNVVTIRTTAPHNFAAGNLVTIAAVADPTFNGTFAVTGVPDNTHFTYAQVAANAASGSGTATHLVHAAWAAGTPILRLRRANDPAANLPTINVQGASQLYHGALVELDNGGQKERFTVQMINGQLVTLSGNPANSYFEGHRMRAIEAEVLARYEKEGVVIAEEDLTNLQLFDDGSASYIVNGVNIRSQLVDLVAPLPGFSDSILADFPAAPPVAAPDPETLWQRLDGGNDHNELLTVDDFVGVDAGSGARTGIQAMEDIEDVSICMVPNIWSTTVQSALITHCEHMKYRFAIVDPQDGLSIDGIRTFREPLDTKYAALYHPWLEVRDPSVSRNVHVAPSGHMAGIYARVDVERGVHKAPANEVIEAITKIHQEITRREQDVLNPVGINALRFFPNRGNRVWGARTVSSDASWKYINVRRLFIYVEHSIDRGTQWVVFEPNDEPLWARVRQTISNFLTTTWRNGALQGAKPDEAFFVKCDHTTMTQDDIDNGRLICVIGIAPVKPAEFVIFRIQQKTLDSKSA